MSLFEKNREPSRWELRITGLLLVAFGALVGWLIRRHLGLAWLATAVWWISAALGLIYYAVPASQRLIFLGWMNALHPIGAVMSRVILGLVYFFLMTPIGWILRIVGYDPLHYKMKSDAATFWTPIRSSGERRSYFRQY